jgi:hypothetical protein
MRIDDDKAIRARAIETHMSARAQTHSESMRGTEHGVTVHLRRMPAQKRERLARLMDKNTERELSQAERAELRRLGLEVERMLLANAEDLARAVRPELFDERGRTLARRLRQVLRQAHHRRVAPTRKNSRA